MTYDPQVIQPIYLFYNFLNSHWQMIPKKFDKKFIKNIFWEHSNLIFKIDNGYNNDITKLESILQMNTLHQLRPPKIKYAKN